MPAPASEPQPGHMQPFANWQGGQVAYTGVPEQLCVWKTCGEGGSEAVALQQIRARPFVQSLSSWHVLAHVAAQRPLQHIGVEAVPLQSEDSMHRVGQFVVAGFKHRPCTRTVASNVCTVVQQISLCAALHIESLVHSVGQFSTGVQMGRE